LSNVDNSYLGNKHAYMAQPWLFTQRIFIWWGESRDWGQKKVMSGIGHQTSWMILCCNYNDNTFIDFIWFVIGPSCDVMLL